MAHSFTVAKVYPGWGMTETSSMMQIAAIANIYIIRPGAEIMCSKKGIFDVSKD